MRYLGIVSYFGMNYDGWQSQPSHNTIEDKIEKLLSHILNEDINITGSGRTDKGVHAYAQPFHFDTKKKIKDMKHLVYALNRLLPVDIKIKSIKEDKRELCNGVFSIGNSPAVLQEDLILVLMRSS